LDAEAKKKGAGEKTRKAYEILKAEKNRQFGKGKSLREGNISKKKNKKH